MPATTIDRATLYEQVWATPLSHLAPTYGVTDVALKKACGRLGVPTPPRGYWAKLRHGHSPPRTPLPPPEPGAPTTYRVRSTAPSEEGEQLARPERPPLPSSLEPPPEVVVPDTLRRPEPLVRETRDILKQAHTDRYGRLRVHDAPIALEVSRASLPRALRIADALIRAARRVGFEIRPPADGGHVQIFVEGEAIPFGIREPSRRERIPESERKWSWDRVRHLPSEELELGFGSSHSGYGRTVRDTQSARLEDRLGHALVEIYYHSHRQREERERWEAWRREQDRKREEERRHAQEREAEKARCQHLEDQALRWQRSQEITAFVDTVEARAASQGLPEEDKASFYAWVRWAREHAARLDPLSEGLPHEPPSPNPSRRRLL